MADPNDQARSQLREFRRVVADVVTELRSAEINDTYAALTLSELVNQRLEILDSRGTRPGKLQRIKAIRDAYLAKIEGLKATAPGVFRTPDPGTDANT